jgi:PrtD family type I secretion system ABC transporter
MYAAGAWLVVQQDMTAGAMMAASIVMARGLSPVEQAIGGWRNLVAARGAWRKLKEFFAADGRAAAIALPEPAGRVVVDRLTYAPRGSSRLLLKGVSFQLAPGEVLAIAGPSGAGKSTLARALVGVVLPIAGHVRLDGAELQSWDRVQLGRHLGYLPQDIELFDGTVRDNIARMGEADDAAVVAAARLVDVHDLILHLPHGYHTRIGEGGAQLSAGQRQRVGLARAVFGGPKLVVLDEPDSALDLDGEAALERAIVELKRAGTTVVVVTHRPRLLGVVDKILVLRAGALEAFGPALDIAQRLLPQALITPPRAPAKPQPAAAAPLARARKETAS